MLPSCMTGCRSSWKSTGLVGLAWQSGEGPDGIAQAFAGRDSANVARVPRRELIAEQRTAVAGPRLQVESEGRDGSG